MTSKVTEHDNVASILKQLKSEMANDDAWTATATWGEVSEAQLREKGRSLNYLEYEVCMMIAPGSARLIQTGKWITGYRFIIEYKFFGIADKELGQESKQCFLGMNEAGGIVQFFEDNEVDNFTTAAEQH